MITTEILVDGDWPDRIDWRATGARAADAALAASAFPMLASCDATIEIAIRMSSDDEVHALNRDYRGKDKATNVLSFPMFAPEEIGGLTASPLPELLLGDIILAHGVCAVEANDKGVSLADHASHLIVHGMLHLLGYDHGDDDTAFDMERRERAAMAALGLHDPYPDAEG